MKTISFTALTLATTLTAGCAGDKKPPAAPSGGTEASSADAVANDGQFPDKEPTKGMIQISDRIKQACGLSDTEAFFAFDSATVDAPYAAVLEKLAKCFTDGPLAGQNMNLVGHADPRGSDEYNMALGGKRAENVKGVLVKKGLAAKQASTSSRGEIDASGTDEGSWAKDRKVEVMLAE